jgi:16S rRNA processing protein RimM
MVVKGERERLVPFIREQVVRRVDVGAGIVEVDWDPEF